MLAASNRRATAITVINLKGGVGKTHTVWLLAGVCQERGKKLLVIDTDTQCVGPSTLDGLSERGSGPARRWTK